MRKAEFIGTLETRLEGEVSDREIESSVRYYDKYFEEAKRNGQSEEEIAQELGSPLLIAKTIIDTSRGGTGEEQAYFREGELYETEEPRQREDIRGYHVDLEGWKAKAVLIGALLLIILLIVTVLRILIPLAVPIAVILVLIYHFKRRR